MSKVEYFRISYIFVDEDYNDMRVALYPLIKRIGECITYIELQEMLEKEFNYGSSLILTEAEVSKEEYNRLVKLIND